MSINGTAQTEYASLSGKIHTFVVDKTLSISGACADAKATGEAIENAVDSVKEESAEYAIEKSLEAVGELADEVARIAAVDAVADEVDKAVDALAILTAAEVSSICDGKGETVDDKLLDKTGLIELLSHMSADDAAVLAACTAADNAIVANGVKIETQSYTGTNAFGPANPTVLTFNFAPQVVFILSATEYYNNEAVQTLVLTPHAAKTFGNHKVNVATTDGGKTVSFNVNTSASVQCNLPVVYYAVGIGR